MMIITIDVWEDKDAKKAVREAQVVMRDLSRDKGNLVDHKQRIGDHERDFGFLKITGCCPD